VVGDRIRTGGGTAELTAELRADYDAAAGDWAGGLTGPEAMYAPLARSLVAAAPVPPAGRLVLDLGAGTGVAGRAALAAGARRVVAADLSEGMLRRGRGGTPVVADAVALPFRDGRFDLVLGMAHYAPFLRSLDPAGRGAARRAAERAVAAAMPDGPLVVSMTVLTAS
jgi:SAM-dependent methyltransferase